ncbi:glycosyltransferase family protein [Mucilaginibacter segetis]|uniref:Uncharacterized protein n=1 Tax=Mucilaginibacter segetis TaxID=2793071 RepID=A0A934PW72_9SPHI|nr:hypothetical protein [Mucilaginibacter segetis]MBK0380657.1 hypothetical protein [Mucilaginibacter segetis]
MKLLSFHPFSLYSNGGGNRILRRLYLGREKNVSTLVVEGTPLKPHQGNIDETIIYASPLTRKWARWKLRNLLIWLRYNTFKPITIRKVQQAAKKIQYDVLHVVQHGPFCAALCTDKFIINKQFWLSVHDHYTTTHTSFDDAKLLWNKADRRLVISDELGKEYRRLFGDYNYEIITDGVKASEIKEPATTGSSPVIIYFAGLLHITYIPLFNVLADALDALSKQGHSFQLILRGTQRIPFLDNRLFATTYREVSLNDAELKQELDSSDILYLPIKFSIPDFYLYSLSTKMVGYLGAPGAILYHGPADSAACHLLQQHNAAVCCGKLDADELSIDILNLIANKADIAANAKQLAMERFDLQQIQKRFWQE